MKSRRFTSRGEPGSFQQRFIEYNFPEAGVKTEGILFFLFFFALFLCCTVNELISDKTSCIQTFTKEKKTKKKGKMVGFILRWLLVNQLNKQPPEEATAAKG